MKIFVFRICVIAVTIAVCSGVPRGLGHSWDDMTGNGKLSDDTMGNGQQSDDIMGKGQKGDGNMVNDQQSDGNVGNGRQSDDIMGNGLDDFETGCDGKPAEYLSCGGKPADIYFAFDTSQGTTTELLKQQVFYASELLRLFYLKQNIVRVGAITYGRRVKIQFGLGVHSERDNIKDAFNKARHVGGSRNTDVALNFLSRRGFAQPEARTNVGQVLLLFMTGAPSNFERTLQQADQLKRLGVYIYVIQMGNDVLEDAISNIVSRPFRDFAFNTVDHGIRDSLVTLLRITMCDDQPAENSQVSKACTAHSPVDLIFAVDVASIGTRNSRHIIDVIERLVNQMDNTTGHINVGLLNSRNVNFGKFWKRFETIENFLTKLKKIRMPDNGEMLLRARRMAHRGRRDTQKTLVIFYDENVDITKRTLEEAKRNKFNDKMEIFVVAIGKNVDTHTMVMISSRPSGTHLIRVPDYNVLSSKHKEILGNICIGW